MYRVDFLGIPRMYPDETSRKDQFNRREIELSRAVGASELVQAKQR